MLSRILNNNKYRNTEFHEEYQYLNLIDDILVHGSTEIGRNGTTKMIYGSAMHFDLSNGQIPILTTKRVAWKTCLKELLWFISGNTDNCVLQEQNVNIWNDNGSRDFLDSVGLTNYRENDLGPIYGFQWRHFNAEYDNCESIYEGQGIDQLYEAIKTLKDPLTRSSRRIIISAWNPCQLKEMALPPCHVLMQFNVKNGHHLSCSLYQRSGDVGLGVPFNIASYSFLTHLLAHHCGLEPDEFIYYLGNTHIYDDHYDSLKLQTERQPYPFPRLKITGKYDNIADYTISDFELEDYKYHESIKMLMRK
jgi:thymidylate synthase